MATQYTSLLGLALPVTGELSGTWGDTVNDSITSLLDSAVAGTTTLNTDADVTLSTTTGAANQARQAIILWTANGTTTRNITAPAQSKAYVVINKSAGTQSIVFRGVGPTTGVTIAKDEAALVAWNGSDFIKVSNTNGAGTFTDLDVTGTTTLDALTASTALALNASKEIVSVTNTGTGNNVLATSPTLTTPNLGTPSAVTLTNATGLPVSTGISGLGSGVATFLATPSSANLAAAVTDETGSGALVFATSPTLTTPTLGAATATSINKVALTAPATGATLTLSDGSSLITSGGHSLTLTTTGATNVTFPTTGTLATTAGTVASISFGTTGLTPNTATTGAVTVAGTLSPANGGTGVNNSTRTLTINSNSGTLNFTAASKTLGITNSITLAGTDATTMTFPSTNATIARTDAAQTFTGTQTFSGAVVANGNVTLGDATSDTITATGRFNTDLVPSTDDARDLGTSALKWKQVYATTFTENGFGVVSQTDIGSGPNEIPLNQYLGALAYEDTETPALDVGTGITTGTGTICKANGGLMGGIYQMTVLIDLTGLNSGGTAGDIIGVNGTANPCYIARLPAMTVLGGRMTCLETPAGGDTDIDLYSAAEGTGVEDQAITALTETEIINAGAQTRGTVTYFSADPAANAYFYLVGQGTANATYTAGRFLIEVFGVL